MPDGFAWETCPHCGRRVLVARDSPRVVCIVCRQEWWRVGAARDNGEASSEKETDDQ